MTNSEERESGWNQDIDKTFVDRPREAPSTSSGTSMGSTSEGENNPYVGHNGEHLLPPGDQEVPLGSGKVTCILGTGGMARIYKIWNESLELYRAIKVLLPFQRPELRDRFETEARITAKLDHPNIVDIQTVGEWNGLPFIEMEYIDGCSLDELIARHGRLPESVCCAIAVFIARALHYAHGLEYLLYGKKYRGIIHRDLKPANIMISREGAVKLMDFGIARPQEASFHTAEGNVVGTLQYLSPEQMDGIEIDCRSDIYSFGAILYEILSGVRTFPQETLTNLMKVKALNQYRDFKELKLQISPLLARITLRCLESDPAKRYENAGKLLTDLEHAHGRLSSMGPERTMQAFCTNPSEFTTGSAGVSKRVRAWLWPVAAAAILAGAGAGAWLWLSPGDKQTELTSSVVEAEQSQETASDTPDTSEQSPAIPPPPPQPDPKPAHTRTSAQAHVERTPKPERTHRPTRRSRPRTPPKPRRTKQVSPAEALKERYKESKLAAAAQKALTAGAYDDVLTALDILKEEGKTGRATTLLRIEALMKSGRLDKAQEIADKANFIDAWLVHLRGRLSHAHGNRKAALEYYQSALTKPSVSKSRTTIRNESLYQTALIYDEIFRTDPVSVNRLKAVTAWNNLKRCYKNREGHVRFKTANEKLAEMR
ncbi:MAG: protein kinase [Chitinivibrionales bacterium]|nr:protein kinase [Chitinivibrionales bacterium]MBD3357662.1 protein kinase [Chitinivibrionales bacterium]